MKKQSEQKHGWMVFELCIGIVALFITAYGIWNAARKENRQSASYETKGDMAGRESNGDFAADAEGESAENVEQVLNAVVISQEGDILLGECGQYNSKEEFLAAYGFAGFNPVYAYHREDGSTQMEFFQREGEDLAVCIRYTDGESMTFSEQEGVTQGYVFLGSSQKEWDYDPFLLEPPEGMDYPDTEPPVYEYNEKGLLTHYHLDGRAEGIWDNQEIHPFLDIAFFYREDQTLEKSEYWHNEMLFGTYGQSADNYFDDRERLIYQSSYITHGRCESYYIYGTDEKRGNEAVPLYRVYLDYNGSQYGSLERYIQPEKKSP